MTNSQIASALAELGTLLELQGESNFRTQAYHVASRVIDQLPEELATRTAPGPIPNLNPSMAEKVETLLQTGHLPQLDEVRSAVPPGLIRMLRIPGLGPKKVRALAQAGIGDLPELKEAAEQGRVAELKGFGAKTQENILAGLAFLAQAGARIRLDVADELAEPLLEFIRGLPGVTRAEVCGSLRRRAETIGSLDFLVAAENPHQVSEAFATLPVAVEVLSRTDELTSVLIAAGRGGRHGSVRGDLRVVTDAQFPFALHYFTGSKGHNTALKAFAHDRGYDLTPFNFVAGAESDFVAGSEGRPQATEGPVNPQALATPRDIEDSAPATKNRDAPGTTFKSPLSPIHNEDDLFQALNLPFIPPELREDTGEIAAAAIGRLPKLISFEDIRGVFHNHTTASDGGHTLEQMVEAAQALDWEYVGIADHSQSLAIARGLKPDQVRAQRREIDALNATLADFRVFHGTECDILPDGRLDFDDQLLSEFDYVVASVHGQFNMPREAMTARIVRAVKHPLVTMLGHATGRLLLRRDAYAMDIDAVLEAAAESGTMIEINAQPTRLDIDWTTARKAKSMGIMIVINPDAHSTGELLYYQYGIDVARRAWLEKDDVFNTKAIDEVTEMLENR
ncbi:MAG: helix-hairpin-helix domain-containing protein [Gemmataceae bacterium]